MCLCAAVFATGCVVGVRAPPVAPVVAAADGAADGAANGAAADGAADVPLADAADDPLAPTRTVKLLQEYGGVNTGLAPFKAAIGLPTTGNHHLPLLVTACGDAGWSGLALADDGSLDRAAESPAAAEIACTLVAGKASVVVAQLFEVRLGEPWYAVKEDALYPSRKNFHGSVIGTSDDMRMTGTGQRGMLRPSWFSALRALGCVAEGDDGGVLWSGFGLTMAYTGLFKNPQLGVVETVGALDR